MMRIEKSDLDALNVKFEGQISTAVMGGGDALISMKLRDIGARAAEAAWIFLEDRPHGVVAQTIETVIADMAGTVTQIGADAGVQPSSLPIFAADAVAAFRARMAELICGGAHGHEGRA